MERMESRTTGTPAGPPSLDRVVARLRALRAEWPVTDGVAVFNRVYLSVTEEIARQIDAGSFAERGPATTLDVLFAERYLSVAEGMANGLRAPACWWPLFRRRDHPDVLPLQFALAGINAHIGHDLALAVVDTCAALDCEPAELAGSFDQVGGVLRRLEERIREEVMPGPDLLELAEPFTHLVGSWSLERARQAAWASALLLWRLRAVPALAARFTDRLDAGVGAVGHRLVTPWRLSAQQLTGIR
ncbi:DUF5995 family protein [Streptomyces sp. NPDC088725]|uniref:DUF5995 family protein n=1 Tax=Streptomyces sp. NPDC088725 TaxID=3365873 RepID=UPI0038146FFA